MKTNSTIPTTAIIPVILCIMNMATRYTIAQGISKSENIPIPVMKPFTIPKSLMASPLEVEPLIDVRLTAFCIRSGVASLSIQSATFAMVKDLQTSSNAEQTNAVNVTRLSISNVDELPLESTLSKT